MQKIFTYYTTYIKTRNRSSIFTRLDVCKNDSKQLPRLEVHTSDKVGETAAAFNSMAETIEGHVQKEEEFIQAKFTVFPL